MPKKYSGVLKQRRIKLLYMRNTDCNFDISTSMFKLRNSSILGPDGDWKQFSTAARKKSHIFKKSLTYLAVVTRALFSEQNLTAFRSDFTVIKFSVSRPNEHRMKYTSVQTFRCSMYLKHVVTWLTYSRVWWLEEKYRNDYYALINSSGALPPTRATALRCQSRGWGIRNFIAAPGAGH